MIYHNARPSQFIIALYRAADQIEIRLRETRIKARRFHVVQQLHWIANAFFCRASFICSSPLSSPAAFLSRRHFEASTGDARDRSMQQFAE